MRASDRELSRAFRLTEDQSEEDLLQVNDEQTQAVVVSHQRRQLAAFVKSRAAQGSAVHRFTEQVMHGLLHRAVMIQRHRLPGLLDCPRVGVHLGT